MFPVKRETTPFSGILKDAIREEMVIGGASQVLVGPEPTATPTSEPAATPEPALDPTATAVPKPTVAPTSAPVPTEAPTVELTASPAKTPAPTATTAPAAAVEATVSSTPDTAATEETGGFGVFGMAVGGILLLTAGFLAGYLVGRKKTA